MYGCQCPKRLFLHKFKRQEADVEDAQTMARFASGTSAGILAQEVFPGGFDAQQDDPYPWESTAIRTNYALKHERVIYEATFIHEDILCAVDILVKTEEGYDVYEVKSVNTVKEAHEMDGALQYYVLKGAGIEVKNFYIMHFDREYVRRGDIDVKKLFKATDITVSCQRRQSWVAENLDVLRDMLRSKQEPDIPMGPQCNKPYACNFQEYCGRLNKAEIEVESRFLSGENEASGLAQDDKGIDNSVNIHQKELLQSFLRSWEYPLHFFDFETCMYGVPEFDESRPWQQVPFQYSLHVLQHPEAPFDHHEFLGKGEGDPREELILHMKERFGEKGSIITWYQSFERGRLSELARDFPEHAEFLEGLIRRVVDLMIPFKSGWVHSEGFGGSASIKNVLPVMVPELSYSALDIQEGGTASLVYTLLAEMDKEEEVSTRKALLEYCKLDTLAMVRIWENLMKFKVDED